MPLGKRTDCGNARYAGVWPSQCANVVDGIQEAFQIGFDFVAVSLNHAKLGTGVGAPHTCIRSDLDLQAQSWTSQIVGVASEVEGDADGKRFASVLGAELGWASYLGLQAVILPSVGRQDPRLAPIVAQAVSRALSTKTFLQIWVQVPVSAPVEEQRSHFNQWHTIRAYSNYHRQVRLALLLGEELPSAERLELWTGEPVRCAIVPVSVFKFNAKGYPTLSKAHQEFLAKLYTLGCQVIVRDDSLGHKLGRNAIRSAQDPDSNPLKPYWEYLSFLFRRMEALSENEQAEFDYRDYLQSPLQPLQDHLESATYEVFERDRTKYETYEEAVYRCLLDKFPLGKVIDGMTIDGEGGGGGGGRPPTVMVVGAGRGPLVMASLRASKRAKVPVRVFAVEKNPNAYVTLLHLHQKEKWGSDVTIVHTDMRSWVTTEKADIMISELLGSFGDNELSPECLDGAQRFLADDGGKLKKEERERERKREREREREGWLAGWLAGLVRASSGPDSDSHSVLVDVCLLSFLFLLIWIHSISEHPSVIHVLPSADHLQPSL